MKKKTKPPRKTSSTKSKKIAPKKKKKPQHIPGPLLNSEALHPGEVLLRRFLAPKGITQAAFTMKLKWKLTRLNKLINGKGGVTALSAMDIAKVTHTTPEYWLKLQSEYDLERAKESHRWSRIRR